jgi:hypothetical protein
VVDDLAGDVGTINSWSITIFTQPSAALTLSGAQSYLVLDPRLWR